MAKIHEELIAIRLSKLIKDSETDASDIAGPEVIQSLEAVAQELVGNGVIVEVIKE